MPPSPSQRWEAIERLRHECRGLGAAEREAFLREACGEDHALRRDVEELLAAESGAEPDPTGTRFGSAASWVGRDLGEWRIVAQVARGGMGDVYRAEPRGSEGPPVAIKFIRAGQATEETLTRFLQEGEVLAGLDSPYIARLLRGGQTDQGEPYLVMEFVDGVPITRYCSERGLSLRERLELFEKVCEGVAHAHRNQVIHRDLKPANIFVDVLGVPRLLDFGISKALNFDDDGELTRTHVRLMTPKYASPQMLRGEAVTTQCDVFALGMVLYELLSGAYPHASAAGDRTRLERAILHEVPELPSQVRSRRREGGAPLPDGSSLSRRQHRDLDAVVMTAMRKEPRERYWTVDELRADLRRVLAGEAVQATSEWSGWRRLRSLRPGREGWAGSWIPIAMMVGVGVLGAAFYLQARAALRSERTAWETAALRTEEAREERRRARRAEAERARLAEELAWARSHQQLVEAEARWRRRELDRARRLLAAIPARHRGWEWEHLEAASRSPEPRWERQVDGPMEGDSLRLSAGGAPASILLAGRELGLRVWSREDDRPLAHERLACTAAFASEAGWWLVRPSGIEARGSRREPGMASGGPRLGEAAGSADGRVLAVAADDGSVRVLALPELWERARLEARAEVRRVRLDAHGARLALLEGERQVSLWSADDGRLLRRWEWPDRVLELDLDPSGRRLALGTEDELVLLEPGQAEAAARTRPGGPVSALAFTPAGERVVLSAGDGALDLRRLPGLERVLRLECFEDRVEELCFAPDGALIGVDAAGVLRLLPGRD